MTSRPPLGHRVRAAVVGGALLALGGWAVGAGNPWGLVLLPLGSWVLSDLWRVARVEGQELVVRGRWARRRVPLRDVRGVGLTRLAHPWVQPAEGPAVPLRMVPARRDGDRPGAADVVRRLRELALAQGADLGPAPHDPAPPARLDRSPGL